MNQPKLKYPRLCRILTYVVVIGAAILPIILVFQFPVPDGVKVVVLLASLCGLLVYLFRNFLVLMMLDMTLAMLSCYRTARSRYPLPPHRSAEAIRSSILRYGIACEPTPIKPTPSALRCKFSNPMTVYTRGIEKVVAAYEVDFLTREVYRDIFSSAIQRCPHPNTQRQVYFYFSRTHSILPLQCWIYSLCVRSPLGAAPY